MSIVQVLFCLFCLGPVGLLPLLPRGRRRCGGLLLGCMVRLAGSTAASDAPAAAEAQQEQELCEVHREGCKRVKPASGWHRAKIVPPGAGWALGARCCAGGRCRAAACPDPPRKSCAKGATGEPATKRVRSAEAVPAEAAGMLQSLLGRLVGISAAPTAPAHAPTTAPPAAALPAAAAPDPTPSSARARSKSPVRPRPAAPPPATQTRYATDGSHVALRLALGAAHGTTAAADLTRTLILPVGKVILRCAVYLKGTNLLAN